MFHTLPPTQTRPIPPRSQVASVPVRFGKTEEKKEYGLRAMSEALTDAMPKYQYTIKDDFCPNYTSKLTFKRATEQVDHLMNPQTGVAKQDLQKFSATEKLGLVEESSDMFFEMYTLDALNKKLITPEMVEKWTKEEIKRVPPGSGSDYEENRSELLSGSAFRKSLATIRQDIIKNAKDTNKEGSLGRFRKMVNKDWAEKQYRDDPAMDILALIGMKFALMSRKDPNYSKDLWAENSKLLWGEGEELREEMKGDGKNDNPKKWLINALSHVYTHPALLPLPGFIFREPILRIVQGELGDQFNVDYKDLMETVFSKQIARQELDYSRPDIDHKIRGDGQVNTNAESMKLGNAKRKCILKPYELWQESAVLKNAMQGANKKKDIAGAVLHTGVLNTGVVPDDNYFRNAKAAPGS